VDCDVKRMRERALQLNGNLKIFEVSCRTGHGLEAWFQWLLEQVTKCKAKGDDPKA
jgi:hydrogenase nickel incorporation protein HypB